MSMEIVVMAVMLATAAERLVEYAVRPLVDRLVPETWRSEVMLYAGLVVGSAFGWFFIGNLFAALFTSEVAGHVLTALFIGGGSNLIHQVFTPAKPAMLNIFKQTPDQLNEPGGAQDDS
jgi:hypothetical protein